MYSCGPTVYRPAHIGNLRTYLLADLVRRALAYHGHRVRSVMNITDVGHMTDELTDAGRDRMLLAMEDEQLSPAEIADKYTTAFFADIAAVNIGGFDAYPKASEHIPQIISLVRALLSRGHAYEANGSIYYDVASFPGYGRLSNQALEEMEAGHRDVAHDPDKRRPQDFLLWKAAGERRELVFDSPWGPGYPGWHIECSAMSMHHLGETFDIHTGGVDNRFPHHEGEIAQSEGAVGHPVVRLWVHGEHLLMGRAKMAKSAGNVVVLDDLRARGLDPLAFRYLCFTARYRRQVHFTDDALDAAATGLRRLRDQIALLGSASPLATDDALRGALADPGALRHHDAFVAAVDDDLDMPGALRVLHEAVADATIAPSVRATLVCSWDAVLGLDLAGGRPLPDDLARLIDERARARKEGDFARADHLRERLRREGIELLDGPEGTSWVRR